MIVRSRRSEKPWSRANVLFVRWLVAWVRFCCQNRVAVVAFAIVTAVFSAYWAATNVSINTSTTDMLADDLPFQQQFVALDKAFPQDYRTIVVVVDGTTPEQTNDAAARLADRLRQHPDLIRSVFYPQGDPFFQRNGLLFLNVDELQNLGSALAGAQPLLSALAADPSLRGLSSVLTLALDNIEQAGGGGGLPQEFETALNAIAGAIDGTGTGTVEPFSWQGAVGGGGDAPLATRRQLLLLEPVFDFSSLQPAARAVDLIRTTVRDLGLGPETGVNVRLTGEPVLVEEELGTVEASVGIANVLSLIVVVSVLVVGMRSRRLVEATTFSLLVGLAWTACFAVVAVGELNLISVAFAVLFIGFGVDFGIHFCLRAKEYLDVGIARGLALEEAAVGVAPGLTLTTISASIGFLSFLPTAYQGLVELGIISSAGMVVALLTTLSVLPAYLALRAPQGAPGPAARRNGEAIERTLQRRARPVLYIALGLAIVSAIAVPFARFDDSPLNLRDPHGAAMRTLNDLLKDKQFDPFRAAVMAKDANEAEEIAARLRRLPEVRRVETANDLVPAQQDEKLAMLGDLALMLAPVLEPSGQPEPVGAQETRAALARLQAAASARAEQSAGARRLADALAHFDPSEANLAALQTALLANFPQLISELRESLEAQPVKLADIPKPLLARRQTDDGRILVEAFPAEDLRDETNRRRFATAVQSAVPQASGEAIAVTEAGRAVVRSFFESGAVTFALIGLLLLVVLRSLRDSLIVMAPLVLAGLLTVATTVAIDVPFNFANVIVLPLLFGLGVSSGINMVVRGRQQAGRSLLATSTPRAVLFSALTTISAFGALAISPHPGMASMGLLLGVALTYSTVCTLTVLPALRVVFSSAEAPGARRSPRRPVGGR
ncbi:MAG: MMPL family transporter [Rhodospirillales bacterium]|nr:MMPL family transporter [Rhodospirillales bacterium]